MWSQCVCVQQGQVERLRVEFGDQLAPKQPQARARIENDDLAVGAHLNTGSVAAGTQRWSAPGSGWSRAPPRISRLCSCSDVANFAGYSNASRAKPKVQLH